MKRSDLDLASLNATAVGSDADGLKEGAQDETHPAQDSIQNKPSKRRRVVDGGGPQPIAMDAFEDEHEHQFRPSAIDAETGQAIAASSSEQPAKVTLAHQMRHEVAVPPGYEYAPLSAHKRLDPPNRSYPFTLDPFQETAVKCIERNESVLVSAHTSAGKTVVAEYAIATALKHGQRVIYTSPIKALSNQKYRELLQEFGDVGLMTGDITINPSASCLVMTTEILRSMMYRGSEVMREVAWVIFDEIHYMRDKSRGVVWEESIILLPHKVRYVFLSATIPNAYQFAQWICKIHLQPCHVVYTNYRPTPLQHYVFPAGGDGIHLCVDEKGTFRTENFAKAVASVSDTAGGNKNMKGNASKPASKQNQSDLFKLVRMIWTRQYQPVIVFSFSKRDCEGNALQMSKLDFNDQAEKDMVTAVYKNAIMALSEDDQELPQIQHLLPLLQRGIGIHHSGLLPILKEVIEILFQEGLIKVIFATETFSIGLNFPAKTVVFTSVKKWDGTDFRCVSSGEYIQMSGRAGRRGLDDRGIVIMMMDEKLEPAAAKDMMKGQADRLDSAFHLTYNMILNLLRVEGISPEYILERSFYQFQQHANVPMLQERLEKLEEEYGGMKVEDEETIAEYYDIRQQLETLRGDMRDVIFHPDYCLPFLQPGRLVRVKTKEGTEYGWGIIVNFTKKTRRDKFGKENESVTTYLVDTLVCCEPGWTTSSPTPRPGPVKEGQRGEMEIIAFDLSDLALFSAIRVYIPKDLRNSDAKAQTLRSINEVQKRFPDGLPLLDPIEDMNIKDEAFLKLIKKIEMLEQRMNENVLAKPENRNLLKERYEAYGAKMAINAQIKSVKKEIKTVTAIIQLDELKARKRILRRLGYTTQSDVIEMKGRVACEISTGDELVLTEMIFNGAFNSLNVEQTVALLSCFVFQEKAEEVTRVREDLQQPVRIMKETARKVAKVSLESKLQIDEEQYLESFRTELMDVVYAWCQGAKFSQICKMTDVFEGSIIRAMRRLEELLRQMAAAAKQIGNVELEKKFAEGIEKIKRDIVFAASLYL